MKTIKPFQTNGMRYGYGANNERICTGAQMGRSRILPEDTDAPIRLHLERVPLGDGGCYDKGGAYWGSGTPLYCAWGDDCALYVRAYDRETAKSLVRHELPAATFYR